MLLTILPQDKPALILGVIFAVLTIAIYVVIIVKAASKRKAQKKERKQPARDDFSYSWHEDNFN